MYIVVSPAKSLDYDSPKRYTNLTHPEFLNQSQILIDLLKQKTLEDLSELMKISTKLADLNDQRNHEWDASMPESLSKACIEAFQGDVYVGLDASSLSDGDINYAQSHLGILSGLYGLLRPLDAMMAYRLEMGTKLDNPRGKNLYAFWGDMIAHKIIERMEDSNSEILINLASNEYFKSVDTREFPFPIVTPVFKDFKNGQYKIISFYAKKARGLLSRYIIENKITEVEDLEGFNVAGYYFDASQSNEKEMMFLRDAPES